LVGGSNGFRRPGYVISAEPGLTYKAKNTTFFANAPIALIRDRTQSVPDKIRTDITGVYAKGDAAFADYAINVGVSFKF
jgi:thioredoxin reductase